MERGRRWGTWHASRASPSQALVRAGVISAVGEKGERRREACTSRREKEERGTGFLGVWLTGRPGLLAGRSTRRERVVLGRLSDAGWAGSSCASAFYARGWSWAGRISGLGRWVG
jgi:hypothetical protein